MRGPGFSLSANGKRAAGQQMQSESRGELLSCDADGLANESVIGEMLKNECGDVGARDAPDLAAGLRRDDLNGTRGGAVGEAGGTDDGPVESAGAELGFHALFVRHGSAKEDGDEGAEERRHVDDAVADAERGDSDDATNVVTVHGCDEVTGDLGFECGFEEGLARSDGIDDCVLRGDGGVEDLRIACVAVKDAGARQRLLGRVMDECGNAVAEFAALLHQGAAGFAVGADDEEIQNGLRAMSSPEGLDAEVVAERVQRYR